MGKGNKLQAFQKGIRKKVLGNKRECGSEPYRTVY
jgi:hypothetical protein